jgi:hypothetical protein
MASKYLVPAYIPRSMATGILPENGPRQSQGFGEDSKINVNNVLLSCTQNVRVIAALP